MRNLPFGVKKFDIRERLGMLSGNCGGRVMEVHENSAIIRFASHEYAIR